MKIITKPFDILYVLLVVGVVGTVGIIIGCVSIISLIGFDASQVLLLSFVCMAIASFMVILMSPERA